MPYPAQSGLSVPVSPWCWVMGMDRSPYHHLTYTPPGEQHQHQPRSPPGGSMTHTRHGEGEYPQPPHSHGEAYPPAGAPQEGYPPQGEGYRTPPPPPPQEERRGTRGDHRPHPYHSSHHQGEPRDIPHIVIDPGESGVGRRPTTIPPLDVHTDRKLTVLTVAAKKQRAHSDSILETHISGLRSPPGVHRQSSSCSDAPTEGPVPSPEELAGGRMVTDQQGVLNLAMGRCTSPDRRPTLLDKPQVPFLWRFKRQTTAEEAQGTSGTSATYWLRRHSDSTLPTDPEDLSTSPTRSLSTGDSGQQETGQPPSETSGNYSQGVILNRLKLKKYLQTRYQTSLQQEGVGEAALEGGTVIKTEVQDPPPPPSPARDFSLPRKPAPLSFLPEGIAREMMHSVSDSDVETEPETPVFTPLDVFSPAPPTPRSTKDSSDIAAGGLKFRFSSFDHLNLSPGDTRSTDRSSESGSMQDERRSPSQMSVVSTGTEKSMEEGSEGGMRDVSPRGTPDPRPLTLSPSHPVSPASHCSSHPVSPVSEGARSHPISPQGEPRPYKAILERIPAHTGRFLSGTHAIMSPSSSSPKEQQFFSTPAPLSAPAYLGESPPEASPYITEPGRTAFPWGAPLPQRIPEQEKGKVHFFPEFFTTTAEFSAMQARAMMEANISPHSPSQQHKFFTPATGKPTLSPTPHATMEQPIPSPFPSPASVDQTIPSPFPSPITLKVEPGSPKTEGSSRKVQQCHFTDRVMEPALGTGSPAFVCPVCGQMFPSNNYLANHMVNHLPSEVLPKGPGDNNKIHLCKVCNRSFSRSDMLTRHMRLHTGLRPYECRVCGQVFSRSDHLHTHLRTHTGEKPYKCPQCPYAAPRRDMITRHLRIHTKHVVRRGRRSYSASSTRDGDEGPRRGQSLSSLDSFESGEQSPGPGVGLKEGEHAQYQHRSSSLASCDSLESPIPSSTASHSSSFDFDPSEIPSDGGACSPSPRGGYRRRHEFPSLSSLPGEDTSHGDADTDIQTSFQKCTVGGNGNGNASGDGEKSSSPNSGARDPSV